jgi:hypothetical protein
MACANLVYPNGFRRPFGGDWGGFLGGFSSLLIAAQPIRFPVPRFPRGAGCRISNCARFAAETDNHCALQSDMPIAVEHVTRSSSISVNPFAALAMILTLV